MEIDSNLLLPKGKALYGITRFREIIAGNSGDKIFEVERSGGQAVLRVCEFGEKKQAHTEFETRWVDYLSAEMEGVVKPIRSINGKLYEVVEAGGKAYILTLQEKARGKKIDSNAPTEFNEKLFYNLGILMGRMHSLTKSYEGNKSCPQFKWNGPHFWRGEIAVLDKDVREGEKRLLEELERLPVGKENYGIVHYDVHTDNFLVEEDKITLIDFDACQFNWYAADIASALFFMARKGADPLKQMTEEKRTEFAETYLISYLKGYLTTNTLSEYWIKKLDLFMRYQMVDEYVAAQQWWPNENEAQRQWYLAWHKNRIKNNLPYVPIDYEKVLDGIS